MGILLLFIVTKMQGCKIAPFVGVRLSVVVAVRGVCAGAVVLCAAAAAAVCVVGVLLELSVHLD